MRTRQARAQFLDVAQARLVVGEHGDEPPVGGGVVLARHEPSKCVKVIR